mmetsp:Transcript_83712/g.236340  ORF Transcript_83712/g.236340 Transcript_83712/m.236340 type:complete len:432 (+) Transcript_83712:869-2164(+)
MTSTPGHTNTSSEHADRLPPNFTPAHPCSTLEAEKKAFKSRESELETLAGAVQRRLAVSLAENDSVVATAKSALNEASLKASRACDQADTLKAANEQLQVQRMLKTLARMTSSRLASSWSIWLGEVRGTRALELDAREGQRHALRLATRVISSLLRGALFGALRKWLQVLTNARMHEALESSLTTEEQLRRKATAARDECDRTSSELEVVQGWLEHVKELLRQAEADRAELHEGLRRANAIIDANDGEQMSLKASIKRHMHAAKRVAAEQDKLKSRLREAEKEADKLRQEVTAVDEENEAMRMKLNVSKRTSDHPARSREVLERMKALQDKSYATEVAMGLAQQEAEKRVQAAERETFSVRKELEDRIFALLETREADERAVEEKLLATRHTAMENREAQVARQKLEEELSSVRAALLTSLRYLKSFGTLC